MEVSTLDAYSTYLIVLRWIHFAAGITWIGLLYFFNLVNVDFMKALDAPTKGKVIPELMPRALWWFRWGAVVTVLVGFMNYMSILTATGERPDVSRVVLVWLGLVVIAYAIIYALLLPKTGALNNGWTLGIVIGIVVAIMSVLMVFFNGPGASNKAMSIGIGGGIGMIMLLNVWAIIWRNQKRIIAWTAENAAKGTAIPPESAKLGRQAFLASRTNFYLSLPLLFFMAAASHYPWFGSK